MRVLIVMFCAHRARSSSVVIGNSISYLRIRMISFQLYGKRAVEGGMNLLVRDLVSVQYWLGNYLHGFLGDNIKCGLIVIPSPRRNGLP